MTDPVQIALLGQNALIREGLRHILERESFEVVHSVEDHLSLTDGECGQLGRNCLIVVDQGARTFNEDDIRTLRARSSDAHIVILVERFDLDSMIGAFRAGVHGYIVKDIGCDSLVGSLQLVALGEKVLPGELADRLPMSIPSNGSEYRSTDELRQMLSGREIEILRCLVIGYPNKLISRRLDISEATVKVHVKAILRKLNVHNRTQAAIFALNHGMDGRPIETPAQIRVIPAVENATAAIVLQAPVASLIHAGEA